MMLKGVRCVLDNGKYKFGDKIKRIIAYFNLSNILFIGFVLSIITLTLIIYHDSPVQDHFYELDKNDVWYGDNWYYTEGMEKDGEPIKSYRKHYLKLDAENGKTTIYTRLDFNPRYNEYFCFRCRAEKATVDVNGERIYTYEIKDEYKDKAIKVYTLQQVRLSSCKKGDIIKLTFENPAQSGYIFQLPAIGDRYALMLYVLSKGANNFIVCGVALMLIVLNFVVSRSSALMSRMQGADSLHWLSMFLTAAIIYLAMDTGCMEIFFGKAAFIFWCNSISLLGLPMPFVMYTKKAFFPDHIRYDILGFINFLIVIFSVLGYIIFSYDITRSYKYIHITIGVGIAMCVISFIQEKFVPAFEVIVGYLAIFVMSLASVITYWQNLMFPASTIFGYGLVIYSIFMLIWSIRSTSELKRARDEMDRARIQREKEAAEEASMQKSKFLSHMSHEIRTPLNAVLGMNELIMRECNDEKIQKYSENIQTAGKTLLAIINDVLDFSKIETGKMELVLAEYSLANMIDDIVMIVDQRIKDKHLELRLDIDEEIPNLLYGDENRIKQIIINILTNAVKYTSTGWIELSVKRSAKTQYLDEDKLMLCVKVTDTGIGVKKEDLAKLFSEFERLDRLKNRSIEGTGLGLNITAKLVELMEGEISVESEYGKGSAFTVKLPQRIEADETIAEYKSSKNKCVENDSDDGNIPSFSGKRVYVVDDNEMNLDVISSILELLEVEVSQASGAKMAIEQLDKEEFDLIMTDDMMPEMNGTELMQYLKSNKEGASFNTPIVVLTANAVAGARDDYINKGFDEYMTKPIDIDVLQKILKKYL